MSEGQGITVTPETLAAKAEEIAEMADKYRAAGGGKEAGKTAIKNQLLKDEAVTDTAQKIVNNIVKYVTDNKADVDLTSKLYLSVTKQLDDLYSKPTNEYVEKLVEEQAPTEKLELSIDELKALREQHNKAVEDFRTLKGVLEMIGMGEQIKNIGDPSAIRGALPGQARKPRKINRLSWKVNGEDVPDEQSTTSGVASLIGTTNKAFKEALTAAGVNIKDPDDFEVEVNGFTVTGTLPDDLRAEKAEGKSEPDSDDDDDEDEATDESAA